MRAVPDIMAEDDKLPTGKGPEGPTTLIPSGTSTISEEDRKKALRRIKDNLRQLAVEMEAISLKSREEVGDNAHEPEDLKGEEHRSPRSDSTHSWVEVEVPHGNGECARDIEGAEEKLDQHRTPGSGNTHCWVEIKIRDGKGESVKKIRCGDCSIEKQEIYAGEAVEAAEKEADSMKGASVQLSQERGLTSEETEKAKRQEYHTHHGSARCEDCVPSADGGREGQQEEVSGLLGSAQCRDCWGPPA